MTHRSRSALRSALIHLVALCTLPTGRRQNSTSELGDKSSGPVTVSGLRLLVRAVAPPHPPRALCRGTHTRSRRPCSGSRAVTWFVTWADGPLVRPYYLAHEHRGHRTPPATPDSVGAGPLVIHGHRMGTPAIPGMAVLGMESAA